MEENNKKVYTILKYIRENNILKTYTELLGKKKEINNIIINPLNHITICSLFEEIKNKYNISQYKNLNTNEMIKHIKMKEHFIGYNIKSQDRIFTFIQDIRIDLYLIFEGKLGEKGFITILNDKILDEAALDCDHLLNIINDFK